MSVLLPLLLLLLLLLLLSLVHLQSSGTPDSGRPLQQWSSSTRPGATTFNVLDYGADPTAGNDSTVAINTAVAAASHQAREPCSPVYLCGLSAPTLWFPAGEYVISGPITGAGCSVRGDGHAIIRQINRSSDIFVAEGAWRWELSGLTLDGGANQVHIGNSNSPTIPRFCEK